MEQGAGTAWPQPLGESRQATIDALCEHFANDALPVEEFERRVEVAHRAATSEELKKLLEDLPGAGVPALRKDGTAPEPRPRARVTAAAHARDQGFVVAVMGGATRRGHWTPARTNYAFALMGGAELDFREAILPPGVTEVQVLTIMGGVDIIVPPGVNVESHGIGIMGGFDSAADLAYDPNAPTLRIAGLALMGGVDVTVRHPGESSREARRRRRQEARERRRLKDSWD
ncbi:MAG: DUF1707 domain-containing protein [Gemmatimonadetes bacterium]|nr:DUF1707 domain-containing protein [Gemmatimonadota bacterium]